MYICVFCIYFPCINCRVWYLFSKKPKKTKGLTARFYADYFTKENRLWCHKKIVKLSIFSVIFVITKKLERLYFDIPSFFLEKISQLRVFEKRCDWNYSNKFRFERQVKELRNELDSLKRQESDAKRRREESVRIVRTFCVALETSCAYMKFKLKAFNQT